MNRLLAVIRDTIPYIKELRPLAGSVAACVAMQQLDYWFDRYPDGFYKFLEPCDHKDYNPGDSWTEELGVSPDEWRTAFDKIGTRHTSKTAFEAANDKFQGKFYCSYFDKKQGKTWYYRNHEKTDAALMDIISNIQERPSTVDGKRQLQGLEPPISIDGKRQLQKPDMPSSLSTESTAESTQIVTTADTADVAPLANALFAAGIRPRSLCASLARIPGAARQLEWYPLRRGEVAKWGPGVLRKSIEEDWAPPKSAATENHANGHTSAAPKPSAAQLDAAIAQEETRLYEALPPKLRAEVDREVEQGSDFSAVMERRFNVKASAWAILNGVK